MSYRKKKSGRGFSHVVENIARSLIKEVEIHADDYVVSCHHHPRFKPMRVSGFRCVHFKDFDELDQYLSVEDPEWRTREWTKLWLRDHWKFLTNEYRREELHTSGKKFRRRILGSIRDQREKKIFAPKVPPDVLAEFIRKQGVFGLRALAKAINQEYGIKVSYETIRRIKKKYNI